MSTYVEEPTLPEYLHGFEAFVLLQLALNERGIFMEEVSDDPDEISNTLRTLHHWGWELECRTDGRIRAARDADAPVPGFRTYHAYVRYRTLDNAAFWQGVVAGACFGRVGLYLDRAGRDIVGELEPFLKPGEDTLPKLNTNDDDDDDDDRDRSFEPDFDPNAAIAAALS